MGCVQSSDKCVRADIPHQLKDISMYDENKGWGESWVQYGEIPLDSVEKYSCIAGNKFYLIDNTGNLYSTSLHKYKRF